MNLPPTVIAPSLLSCDFARLADEIARVEAAGADWLQVDVMDGHFVPNLTIGPPVVARIAKVARVPLDVHLMISDPARYAPDFARAGAHVLTFHVEVCPDEAAARAVAASFRAQKIARVGIALNPDTPVAPGRRRRMPAEKRPGRKPAAQAAPPSAPAVPSPDPVPLPSAAEGAQPAKDFAPEPARKAPREGEDEIPGLEGQDETPMGEG